MESKNIDFQAEFITANTNTTLRALDFNKYNRLVAYSASNLVLIMDPYHQPDTNNEKRVPKVLFSLRGHADRVNGVQWIDNNSIVSISADKSFIIWGGDSEDLRDPQNWTIKMQYSEAHKEAINYLRTYRHPKTNEIYIVTLCTLGTLKLWQGKDRHSIAYKDQLIYGNNLQEAAGIVEFGEKHLLISIGGYDSKIHIYLVPTIENQDAEQRSVFKYKLSLPGHFNAIRDFDFTPQYLGNNIRYLASSSQDNNIRLWKIQPLDNISNDHGGHQEDDLQKYESKTSFVLQDSNEDTVYNITLESVLSSHQDSVSSVKWGQISEINQNSTLQQYCLLSSAFDFTVSIWKNDETGLWQVDSTLGAMAGNKHAFYGALFLNDNQSILAYTYNGAMHRWDKEQQMDQDSFKWQAQLTVKGHFGEVTDLDWDQYEANLVTCSQDQTTRLFSRYGQNIGWAEFTRPQIHGYDMNTLAVLKVNKQSGLNLPSRILSGGDEKVLRLFEAPYSFVKIFNELNPESSEIQLRYSDIKTNQEVEELIGEEAAKKQPLGLMNKPTLILANKGQRMDEEEGGMGGDFDPNKYLTNTKDAQENIISDKDLHGEPPLEDILMTRTLWPEQQKLYGHAFEIFAVATSYKGDCAASSCKAKEKKYADIIIWDLTKSQTTVPSCRLAAHNLTVVQLEFSKCDNYLLSSSRDRSWALFQRQSPDSLQFTLFRRMKDAHTRIIWGVSWSHDDEYFATASREKQKSIKVFKGVQGITEGFKAGDLISELPEDQNQNATAIRFFPSRINGSTSYGLIVGLESGDIIIWKENENFKSWTELYKVRDYLAHSLSIKRIKFNLKQSNPKEDEYKVATAGTDHTVRIFKINLH